MKLEIKYKNPPNIGQIKSVLPIGRNNIFCYGNVLYVPSKVEVPQDIMCHEEVHARQQSVYSAPSFWWDKYLGDKEFRLSQELEAYARQLEFVKYNYTARGVKECLDELANNLSTLYNLDIDFNKAKTMIRKFGK